MKIKLSSLAIALTLAGALSGCGVMIDDGAGLMVSTQPAVVTVDSTTYSDDYGYGYHHHGWDDDVTVVDTTTVVAQPAPVVVQPVVYGPSQPAQPAQTASKDPIIQSFTASPSNNVQPGQPVTFTVVANDPNHQALQFNWTSTGGLLSTNTGRVVTWNPPATAGTYTVTAIITNGNGGVVTGIQNLTVANNGAVTMATATTTTTTATASTTTVAAAPTNATAPAPAAERVRGRGSY